MSLKQTYVSERSVDAPRPLKVIGIGAGFSGVITAIKLPKKVERLDLTIYDKNPEVGGTWWENRYPGCACDIPAHVYQLSFESHVGWSKFYAGANEILEYIKGVVEKYNLRRLIRLSHKAIEARWDEGAAKWKVKFEKTDTGEIVHDEADVLLSNIGGLNSWKWPIIDGLKDFRGTLLHSANWDPEFDYSGKSLAVIGSGSSGIQVMPAVQPFAKRVDHYVRGRTWIADTFNEAEVNKRGGVGNVEFTDEEIRVWRDHPDIYLEYRKRLEQSLQTGYTVTQKGSAANKAAKQAFIELMTKRLGTRKDIAEHMIPAFNPLCRRLTPGPGYLESLTQPNVEVIPASIQRITTTGVATTDGQHREVDAIICCTGFDTSFRNRYAVYGREGILLSDHYRQRARSYLSLATDNFPNHFMSLGPNSAQGAGNLLVEIETIGDYVAQALRKMQLENIRTMAPTTRAVDVFSDFCEEYFKRTVFSEECSSWYKTEGRVSALWPGSSLHSLAALRRPRWEDFEYTYVDENPAGWLGDGFSTLDRDETADRAWYLEGSRMLHESLDPKASKAATVNGKVNGTGQTLAGQNPS